MTKTNETTREEAALKLSVDIEDALRLTETTIELLDPITTDLEPSPMAVADVMRRRRMIDTTLRMCRDLLESLLWDALCAPDEDFPGVQEAE